MAAPAGYLNPLDSPYNAAQDGSTNDAAALNAALAACASNGKDLWVPSRNSFRITSTVTVPVGVSIGGVALAVTWAGSGANPALVVGASGTANPRVSGTFAIDGGGDSWGVGNTGIRLYNPQFGRFRFLWATGFTVGVEFLSNGGGGAFANISEMGEIRDNQCQLQLNGSSVGAMDNFFMGGRCSVFGTTGAGNDRGLMRIYGGNSAGNIWTRTPWEANRGTTGDVMWHLWSQGHENEMHSIRDEGDFNVNEGDFHVIADGASAYGNVLHRGYWQGNVAVARINGAPSGQNAANTMRWEPATSDNIGGIQF